MEYVKLSEVFEFIRNGASIKQFDTKEGYPITRIETIANGYVDLNKMGYANIMDLNKYEDYLLQNGDILMSHINSEKHLGKVAIYENMDKSIIHGMNLLCLRPNKEIIHPKYVYYYFNNDDFKRQLPKITKKSVNQASFSVNDLKNLKIKITNLDTQMRIVNVLNKSQELIIKKRKQVQELDKLVKSRFVEMFGDVNINNKKWTIIKLDELIDVIGGYSFKSTDFLEEGIPVLKIGNINSGYFKSTNLVFWKKDKKLDRYLIKPKDLVISLTGTVGKDDYGNVCIMGDDYDEYYLNQRNAKLDIKNKDLLNQYYLTYILKVPEIKKRLTGISRGVRQANIANKDIQNLELPLPPIELQNQFADFVKQVDKLKFEMEKSLKELEDNFNSLMKKAFKGELFE
ncbi:MAG: restriction endonuclease subunit S [Intestinibacter sp.]|uniref:restriction endonuclease subunit S n=1 Tax=Intestinibacter sp. TaxID=1965304 RepID=UPI002A84128E|nr:restriction endonuclease subunit S [Intestinibacter sp.]MDY4575667.1 restriction endonuclease subunit S [Intestinibacter sp.]